MLQETHITNTRKKLLWKSKNKKNIDFKKAKTNVKQFATDYSLNIKRNITRKQEENK